MHARQASKKSQEAMREWDTATVAQLILFPCLPYLLWAVLYYIKVRCFFRCSMQDGNRRLWEPAYCLLCDASDEIIRFSTAEVV